MKTTVYEEELKILEILWCEGETTTKKLINTLKKQENWYELITLQVIRECTKKGLIKKSGVNDRYHAMVKREAVKLEKRNHNRLDEVVDLLTTFLLGNNKITK